MPYYVIAHAGPLTAQHRDALAATITKIHTTLFTTPSLFVNVKFEDVSAASYYVGGRRAQVNTIHANVRTGSSRPRSAYDELCRQLRAAWEELLPSSTPLHAVFVHGSLVAGEEQGFLRPEAGNDAEWVRVNMPEFEKRAAAGNEDMKLLVEECKTRGLGV
ncbi:hypothetical protein N0V93_003879 [Gnomoniopsis smithogilvyi]|uniref:Tautomerase cis-CaaD-like domain-containing protein n=1 Tax=Gnomoniopsis smithogilvyi TaxID=1191159 RepID=A0A9W9CZ22_9PEZI|nr:hypothetical protein N0V93_003879 [Gnomoniopsis smithogilvyi]